MRIIFSVGTSALAPSFRIVNYDGSVFADWSTVGVTESPAGSGVYGADVPVASLAGRVAEWRTNEAVQRYGSEPFPPSLSITPATPADLAPLATVADVLAVQGNVVAAMPSGFATPADVTSARDAIVAVIDTPADWIAITPATLDTNGDALGSIDRADVEIVAYLSTDESLATPISKTVSEIDGGFTLRVPPAATYTLVARAVGRSYGNRTVTV